MPRERASIHPCAEARLIPTRRKKPRTICPTCAEALAQTSCKHLQKVHLVPPATRQGKRNDLTSVSMPTKVQVPPQEKKHRPNLITHW